MNDTPLTLWILAELFLVLIALLCFCVHYIRKQHKRLAQLLEKFNELKAAYQNDQIGANGSSGKNSAVNNDGNGKGAAQPSVAEFFAVTLADSLQRYEKYTHSVLPHFDQNHPLSGRIAALRSIYLTAEKELFEDSGITRTGWAALEKKLADVVRWQDKKMSYKQEVRSNRTRHLQEKIASLKQHEADNKMLIRKVQRLQERKDELERYKAESQQTINNLQTMLDELRKIQGLPSPSLTTDQGASWQAQPHDQLDDLTTKQMPALQILLAELKHYPTAFTPERRKKMEEHLNVLELELFKSDQYITNLKRELKEAKIQATNYALMLRDTPHGGNEVHEKTLAKAADLQEQREIVKEISLLRENNQRQREIIAQLNMEISALRQSVDAMDSSAVNDEKEREISRLERLVRDCQNCIDTLENEVENLYTRLQQRAEKAVETGDGDALEGSENDIDGESGEIVATSSSANEELDMIVQELEKTITHYQQLHAINGFMVDLIKCDSINVLAQHLIQFIEAFNAPIGFGIYSQAGKAEYFPEALFEPQLQELCRAAKSANAVTHLPDGTLFSYANIRLMLLPAREGMRPILETSLQSLVAVVNECVKRLDSTGHMSPTAGENSEWAQMTRSLLSDLGIKYAYHIEENRKTFNRFIDALRKAYHLLELKGPGAVLLDNAVNEFEQRMHLLIDSSELIDAEITKLIDHMGQLENA